MFCQLFPPAVYGGGEVVFFEWAKGLVSKGHEVMVITQRLKDCKSFEEINGIKVHRVGLPIEYNGALSLNFLTNLSYLLGSFLKSLSLSPDLVHSNTYVPSLSAQLFSKLRGVPHIMTVHDVYLLNRKKFWKKWSNQKGVGFFSKILGPFIEKFVLNMNISLVHTVSDTSRKDILSVSKKNSVVVIPNGINFSNYKIKKKVSRNYSQFVYLGRHVFYKNLDVVLKALVNIPDASLVVMGDGPMRESWERLAKKLGISERVEFTGYVSHKKKLGYLASSAGLVLPSSVEGFGVCIIESMVLGTPCLVNDQMPLPELVKHNKNGYVIKDNNVKNWTKYLNKLCDNKSLFKKLSKNSKKFVKDYSIEKVVKELESIYKFLGKK